MNAPKGYWHILLSDRQEPPRELTLADLAEGQTLHDSGEGPWTVEDDARTFAESEVGRPYLIVCLSKGPWEIDPNE